MISQELASRSSVSTRAKVSVILDGKPLQASRELGSGAREFSIPLADVRGKHLSLMLAGDSDATIGFSVSARFRRPVTKTSAPPASRTKGGPDIHRILTDPKGRPVEETFVAPEAGLPKTESASAEVCS